MNDFREIPICPTKQILDSNLDLLLQDINIEGPFSSTHHYADAMFRLLYADFIQPLKEALADVYSKKRHNIKCYTNVQIIGMDVDDGIHHMLSLGTGGSGSSFKNGSLLCLSCDQFNSIGFATVINKDKNKPTKEVVFVKFENCLDFIFSCASDTNFIMFESPCFFEAYSHVLEGLKEMASLPLPIENYRVFGYTKVQQPSYLSGSSQYNLSTLFRQGVNAQYFNPFSPSQWPDANRLGLNKQQLEAVKSALTKELCLIQGPPGTGKTFISLVIMRLLLENRWVVISHRNPSPILVVCYTNHALDQFLQGVLQFCTEGLVRIGGNSTCEDLVRFNLRNVRENYQKPRGFFKSINGCNRQLKKLGRSLKENYEKICYANDFILDVLLLQDYMNPSHFQSIRSSSHNEDILYCWLGGDSNKNNIAQVFDNLDSCDPMDSTEENTLRQLWKLDQTTRYRLYKLWLSRYLNEIKRNFLINLENYEAVLAKKTQVRQEEDLAILKASRVVGVTTTGAAKRRKLLQAVGATIVIVEEAAEVSEPHTITAISQHCEHLILVGDHQQLRPKTESYELAKTFGLDISLFERLIKNNLNFIQLKEQHRMRPEISIYARHIYPELTDGVSVLLRPPVRGLEKSVHFINHAFLEDSVNATKSKRNKYEARYLTKLCQYLILQGYSDTEISILGMYEGQVSLIKQYVSKVPAVRDVLVTTVDNFQGEQNKIILLSLVRSNDRENIGFLSSDNRVCVAMTRAQHGLYVLGNIDLLARKSRLWGNIKQSAELEKCISPILKLTCVQHDSYQIKDISRFDDVIKTGGCGKLCQKKLTCGHVCPYLCHVTDHKDLVCQQDCLNAFGFDNIYSDRNYTAMALGL
ncbi:NFX1-type zinc finger-containing protein 1-like [Physella acuta]|uniref:NFX1-type zinc finger-containing protein 1-like n=1 Tax=Physella acuta TaxID=109671 RepID=UPI0027DDCC47|nr:NFX1-type zinc finger-containing protein 1-like [Physella acuta]